MANYKMAVSTFQEYLRFVLPRVVERGYVEKAACGEFAPGDPETLERLIETAEDTTLSEREEREILGYLTSIASERLAGLGTLRIRRKLDYVGYSLNNPQAKIVVPRDAGDFLGAFMQAGSIVCEGSCGDFAFRGASGGRGLILGNAGDFLAEELSGEASIEVRGSVRRSAGRAMRGGELIIRGDAGEFFCRYMKGGVAKARRVALLGETFRGEIHALEVRAFEKGRAGIHRARLILGK